MLQLLEYFSRSRTMDVSVGVPVHPAKEKPPINVVGDVGGRIAIMVVRILLVFFFLTLAIKYFNQASAFILIFKSCVVGH